MPLLEFLQDLGSCSRPTGRLNAAFGDLPRASFQLSRPCSGNLIAWLLEAGEQFLRHASAVSTSEAQDLGKQLVRRHGVSVASP